MKRKPEFLTELDTRELIGSKYAVYLADFGYYSAILVREILIPAGMICDYESIPLFKSDSKRAGGLHDYLCRKDSDPIVSKQMAAAVYAEAQQLRDSLVYADTSQPKKWLKLALRGLVCHCKTGVVRVWPFYFHQHLVSASVSDLAG